MENKKHKKSLDELIISNDKLKKVNRDITIYWVKILLPIAIIFTALLVGYLNNAQHLYDLENKSLFTCKSIVQDSIEITIDKRDGWKLEDGYFIKEGNKVSIERCKAIEEEINE